MIYLYISLFLKQQNEDLLVKKDKIKGRK